MSDRPKGRRSNLYYMVLGIIAYLQEGDSRDIAYTIGFSTNDLVVNALEELQRDGYIAEANGIYYRTNKALPIEELK